MLRLVHFFTLHPVFKDQIQKINVYKTDNLLITTAEGSWLKADTLRNKR